MVVVVALWLEVFPAQAGVIPTVTDIDFSIIGFPRASGGDPTFVMLDNVTLMFSPRKRG